MDNMETASHFVLDLACDVNESDNTSTFSHALADVTKFGGAISYDTSKPDGTPCKLFDESRRTSPGWRASIELTDWPRHTAGTGAMPWRRGVSSDGGEPMTFLEGDALAMQDAGLGLTR